MDRSSRRAGAGDSWSILTLGNLRGIRESGKIFAAPTYFFIVSVLATDRGRLWRAMTGAVVPVETIEPMARSASR